MPSIKNRVEGLLSAHQDENSAGKISTLAASFLMERTFSPLATRHVWSLIPLDDLSSIDLETYSSEGGQAWAALHSVDQKGGSLSHLIVTVDTEHGACSVTWSAGPSMIVDNLLIAILSRVLAQWALRKHQDEGPDEWVLEFPNEKEKVRVAVTDFETEVGAAMLFDNFADGSEMVEMVDQCGRPLGCVPRKLVHKFNLLHRGIGLFVTKNSPISCDANPKPDLYVHRRTDCKRIFPSLYDMFVGGVSLAGEEANNHGPKRS